MNDIGQTFSQATAAQTKMPFSMKVKHWFESRSATEIFLVIMTAAVMIAFTLWESINSANGWMLLAKGVAPIPVAAIAGFAMPIGVFVFHRRSFEFFRAKANDAAIRAVIVTLALTALTLWGVFSNIASKTELSAAQAGEFNQDRALLRSELQALNLEVTDDVYLQAESLVQVTATQIKSTEAEATGWGMADTEPDGACASDLRTRERQLCNRLNGSDTDMGLRNRLVMAQNNITALDAKKARQAELRTLLAEMPKQEGEFHWQAMSAISGGTVDAGGFRIGGSMFVSLFVLIVLAFGWDLFFEAREDELEEALKEASNG